MEIKNFSNADFDKVYTLLNKNLDYDTLTENLLREKIYDDPRFDPELTLLSWHGETLSGFMFGLTQDKKGYIKLMAVEKQYRRKGIAEKLYSTVEKSFKKRGINSVRFYSVPANYFMPGIDPRYTSAVCFAESMGFEHISQLDTTNMTVSLNSQDFNTEQIESDWKKKDVTFRRADYNDYNAVIDFMRENFPVWEAEVKNTFNSLPISIHLAMKNETIVAFSAHNANNFGTGWFGPMGTVKEYRGHGIGAVLLKRCLQDIKEWKLDEAIIPWVRPIRFYAREVNAVINRVFWQFEKSL